MITKKLGYLATTAIVSSLVISGSAFAQSGGDEIIVTATKRETTLQATPVAVSVTGEETIEQARILDLNDLQSVVPSLRVNQLQSSQNTNFVIRGFGNGANNAGIEPSVGVFIDGVYRSRSAARIGDLPKLSRIEVLRGPQSTLFGKNASAGVVSIVTATPSYENEGYLELGYGNYNNFTGKAYMTGGMSDNIAFSFGGGFNLRDGYVENGFGDLDDINSRNRWNVRGQLLVEPTDATSIRLIADYSTADENCCAVTNYQNEGAFAAISALGGVVADADDPFALVGYQNFDAVNELDDYGFSMHIDHDFGNMALTSISSYRDNASFYNTDADYGTLDLLAAVISDQNISTITQELRLASTGSNQLDWMVGGYYFHEDVEQLGGLNYGSDLLNYLDLLAGGPGTIDGLTGLFGFPAGTAFSDTTQMRETFTQDNTAYSIFGTVDFHINDRLTLTGGLNYTNDDKTVTGSTVNNDVFSNLDLTNQLTVFGVPLPDVLLGQQLPGLFAACGAIDVPSLLAAPACGGPLAGLTGAQAFGVAQQGVADGITGLEALQFQPQFLAFPNVVEDGKTSDDKLTWNIRAAYEVNDNFNVYASASTGFKSSSWNLSRDSRPFISDAGALAAAGLLPNNYVAATGRNFGTRFAGPEEATVYELGLKAKFDRVAFNLAVFDQSIKGFQSNTFLGTGFSLANAGEQSTQGVEVDATFTPVDPLTISVAATFLDPVYDSFVGGPGPGGTVVDLSGEKPAGIPTTSLSAGLAYNHEFASGATGFLRGDWQYESNVQSNEAINVTTGAEQPFRTVSTFNASTGFALENGISIQLWARNLFNDEYVSTVFPGVAQAGIINGYRNPPRTYGVNLRQSW